MILKDLAPEVAKDLIELINALGKLPKTASVKYGNTKFSYVPLDDMLAKIKENNNFAFMQPLGILEDGTPCIQCLLIHKSGVTINSDPYRLVVNPNEKKQMEGSEITYSRRYCMASFFGIASDDDTDATDPEPSKPVKRKLISDQAATKVNEAIITYNKLSGTPTKDIVKDIERVIQKPMQDLTENNISFVMSYLKGKIEKINQSKNDKSA